MGVWTAVTVVGAAGIVTTWALLKLAAWAVADERNDLMYETRNVEGEAVTPMADHVRSVFYTVLVGAVLLVYGPGIVSWGKGVYWMIMGAF